MGISKKLTLMIAAIAAVHILNTAVAFDQTTLRGYRFDWIASTDHDITNFNSPQLTDAGAIAFRAYHQDGSSAIYYSQGETPHRIIESGFTAEGGRFDLIEGYFDMNNEGAIAFGTSYIGTLDSAVFGVYTLTPDGSVTRVSQNDPSTFMFTLGISINDVGEVVFRKSASSSMDIYGITSSRPELVFNGSHHNHFPSWPEINNNGLVVFAGDRGGQYDSDSIYTFANGQLTNLGHPQNGGDIYSPALNNHNEIVYVQEMPTDDCELVLLESGQFQILPVTGVLPYNVKISDFGVIAYYGFDSNGIEGLRTYDNGKLADVLKQGDAIFGRQTSFLSVWDINAANQLALSVSFADGSEAIIIASPVPEPMAGFLLALSGLSISFRCVRMHR
jgi:hypothetical protein